MRKYLNGCLLIDLGVMTFQEVNKGHRKQAGMKRTQG